MTNSSFASVPDGVNSLYRRFRPGRFSEIRGQDHVVRALQGAVANDRVVHAYLFSGPRGTGKTSTARILAKALNCTNLSDGDPCNACASCVAITQGASLDVIELDAASNNGVEYVRELAASAWIGTAGRHRVYIIDEVHMLTKASSNALLKTLEEPPHGVVFVLATTDPHKVLDTIKSRTQHLEFRLIAPSVLHELLVDVIERASLTVEPESLDVAIQRAKGSARDALSALDQIVASGLRPDLRANFDGLFDALARTDVIAALGAVAALSREGWDPEQLAENFIGELRQTFLLLTAPDLSSTYGGDRERLAAWGQHIGLPGIVRAIEALGRSVREMHSAPDATVVLEVTLARLTHPELDSNLTSLLERVAKLEKQIAQGVAAPETKSVAPNKPIAGLRRVGTNPTPPPPAGDHPAPMTIGKTRFAWGSRTFVMGSINATPDSFSGDGVVDPAAAAARGVAVHETIAQRAETPLAAWQRGFARSHGDAFVVASGHRPLYCSSGGKDCANFAGLLREQVEEAFHAHEVDIVIAGHK